MTLLAYALLVFILLKGPHWAYRAVFIRMPDRVIQMAIRNEMLFYSITLGLFAALTLGAWMLGGEELGVQHETSLVNWASLLGLAVALVFLTGAVRRAVRARRNKTGFVVALPLPENSPSTYVSLVAVGPIVEEVIYRLLVVGAILNINSELPGWLVVGVAAVLFSIAHTSKASSSPEQFGLVIGGLLHGIVLGAAYWTTGNILVPIVLHMIVNGRLLLGILIAGKDAVEHLVPSSADAPVVATDPVVNR